jgi:hypothetical protein
MQDKEKAAEKIVDERLAGVEIPDCYRYLMVDCAIAGDKSGYARGFKDGLANAIGHQSDWSDKHPPAINLIDTTGKVWSIGRTPTKMLKKGGKRK